MRSTILMCCDQNFFPFALHLALQINQKWPNRKFDISIMHLGDLEETELCEDNNIKLIPFELPEGWSKFETSNRITIAAYMRIAAPSILSEKYDRILYLDSDIIYQRGDIDMLFKLDLLGYPVAAVRDNYQVRKLSRQVKEFKAAELPAAPYFNSGVLLIDVPAFVDQEIEAKCMSWADHDDPVIRRRHDQSALNLALYKNWIELPISWNWPCLHKYFFFAHFAAPCFVHFISTRKPWRDIDGIYPREYVLQYEHFLKSNFPILAEKMPERAQASHSKLKWLLIGIRHVFDFGRFLPFLESFSHDFDIKKPD